MQQLAGSAVARGFWQGRFGRDRAWQHSPGMRNQMEKKMTWKLGLYSFRKLCRIPVGIGENVVRIIFHTCCHFGSRNVDQVPHGLFEGIGCVPGWEGIMAMGL